MSIFIKIYWEFLQDLFFMFYGGQKGYYVYFRYYIFFFFLGFVCDRIILVQRIFNNEIIIYFIIDKFEIFLVQI